MNLRLKRGVAAVAAIAAIGTVAPVFLASSASALTVKSNTPVVNPTTGGPTTTFTMSVSESGGGTGVCPGDGAAGWYWSTFIIPASANIQTLSFQGSGTPVQVGGEFRQNLFAATGGAVRLRGPDAGANTITGIPGFNFNPIASAIPAGAYQYGIACHGGPSGVAVVDTAWVRTITVSGAGAGFTWALGAAPSAPTIGAVVPGDGTLTVPFTAPAADPAITGYTLSATPQGGGPAVTQTGATSPITLTGLVNGTTYDLSLTATSPAGTSPAGTGVGTPAPGVRPGVTGLTATPATGLVDLAWTAPTGVAPTGYSLVITPQGGSATTVTLGAGATSYQATGLAAGTPVTFQLTPLHPTPYTASASTVTSTPLAAQVLLQDITVTRPNGALVLTQVCGAYGSLAGEGTQLGFPSGLTAATAVNSSTVAAPTSGGTAPTTGAAPGGPADPVRSQYPYPTLADGTANATYPTHCGINLGNAKYVTSGAGAGQFFAAEGRLNQVTVVDTRDGDLGWNVVGQVSNFTAGAGQSFSGSQLGWTPVATEDTGSFTDSLGNSYDQVTAAGAAIAPNTAVASGLSSNRTLLSAAAFHTTGAAASAGGLGTAIADARLKLLIPVTAQSGVYSAVLTISTL